MYALVSYVTSKAMDLPPKPKRPPLPKVHPVKRFQAVIVPYEVAQKQADENFQNRVKEIVNKNKN